MDNINCGNHDCTAPLCPLACQNSAQWFPDEDVCKSLAYRRLLWIRTQRKIHRLYLKGDISGDETCFTQSMLENIKQVRQGIQGIKPENLYKNMGGQTSTMPLFCAKPPPDSLGERNTRLTPTDSSSSAGNITNQGLMFNDKA